MALSWMEEEGRVVGVEFGVDGRKGRVAVVCAVGVGEEGEAEWRCGEGGEDEVEGGGDVGHG